MAKNKRKHRSKGRRPAYSKEILGLAALMVAQKKLIPLKDDVSFKMFLSSPTAESNACLRSMLSAMTGREITRARVTNSELIPEFARGKMPRMDVNCTFNDGQKADIELQLTTAGDDQKLRALYYASKLYAGSLRKGKLYKNAPSVYQIFLTDFDPFDDSKNDGEKENIRTGKFYHRAMMRLDDGSVFADRLQILFFNLNVPDGVDEGLKKASNWCKFISGSTDPKVLEVLGNDDGWKEEFRMAMDAYMKVSAEEKAWAYHLSTDRAEADYWNGLRLSRDEGRKEGLEDGLKEGISRGIVSSLKNLIANTGMTQSQAMDALGIQEADRDKFATMLKP